MNLLTLRTAGPRRRAHARDFKLRVPEPYLARMQTRRRPI